MLKKLFFCFIFIAASCSQNLYQGMSNTTSDAALFSQAKEKISSADWDTAIAKFELMSASYLRNRDVLFQYATALAGKCGFNYLDFTTALAANSVGSTAGTYPFFLWLLNTYVDKDVTPLKSGVTAPTALTDSYCSNASYQLDLIKAYYGSWNTTETNFVVMFSLAKIGIYTRYLADLDGTNSLGDGIIDSTFDACDSGTVSDFYMTQVVTGFATVLNNFTNVISGDAGAALGAIQTLCSTGLEFCSHTNPADVTANDLLNIRSMLMLDDQAPGLTGFGLNEFTSAVPLASSSPGGGAWRCDALGAVPPPPELLLNCCP